MIARVRRIAHSLALPCALLFAAPQLAIAAGKDASAEAKKAATDAAAHLSAGDKAAREKDWAKALSEYSAANGILPSARALAGMGDALYEQHKLPEAYDVFRELLKSYESELKGAAKSSAEARFKDISAKTGFLSIRVNEAGALVTVDGHSLGTTPVPALVRIAIGPHKIVVAKDGYSPFEKSSNVSSDGKDVVDVLLQREAKLGHVVVKEKNAQAVRVSLDGVDVGPAPYEADIEPGRHEFTGRGASLIAPGVTIDVVKGKSAEVELVASAFSARLEVKTSDGRGLVTIDGKPVAEGKYAGEVGVGSHVIEVSREGFETYRKEVTLADKQTVVESVTLKSSVKAADPALAKSTGERLAEGVYGGINAFAVYEPSNSGNDLQTRCLELGASSCHAPKPWGGGGFFYVGYNLDPVGFEVMAGGLVDETSPSARFEQPPSSNVNVATALPSRKESFIFLRAGGIAAIQARYTHPWKMFRPSIAAGVGAAYKLLLMKRSVAGLPNGDGVSEFVPGSVSYFSPAITLDAAVQFRLTPTTAISLGAIAWIENAGTGAASEAKKTGTGTILLQGGAAHPVPTPSYVEASGPQVFVGPYLGVQFGP